jgi:hypothetical protein
MRTILHVFVFALLLSWVPTAAEAAITVPAGSRPALNWNVAGGYVLPGPGYVAAFCVGGADPLAGSAVYNEWAGTVRTGPSGQHRFVGSFSVPGGPYQFRCTMANNQQAVDTITVTAAPVNGAVGPADGAPTPRVPTTGLCSAGVPSVVTTTATEYTWSCLGTNGGTTDTTGNAPRVTASFFAVPTCDIPSLGNTCSASVTFTSSNGGAVDLKDDTGLLLGTFPTGPQSTTVTVPYNFRVLRIFHNATQVQLTTVTATSLCVFQTTWNGAACMPNAGVPGAPTVTVTPALVNPGQAATLTVTPTTGAPTVYNVYYAGTNTQIPGGVNRAIGLPTIATPANIITTTYEVTVRNAVTFSPRTTAIVRVNSAPDIYGTMDGVTPVGTPVAGSNNQVLAAGLTGNSFNAPFLMAVDYESQPITYTWQFVSGPTVPTLSNGVNGRAQVIGNLNSSATYVFNFIATDSMGLSRSIPVTLTTTVPPPAMAVTVNGLPSPLTIPNASAFTLAMTSSFGVSGVWTRTTDGVADWTNQPIPVANGGPTQYNSGSLVFAGRPATTTYVWTFTVTNAVGVARFASYSLTILPALPTVSVLPPPGSTNFGTIPVGSVSTLPFTVSNTGPAGSLLSGVAQSSDPHFTCGATCAYNNVPSGGTATVTFTYTPTGPPFASHSTTLTFTNTQGTSVTAGIPGSVIGTAMSPIQFGPATGLDFGTVVIGRDKVMTITIRNLSTSLIPSFSLTSNAPVDAHFVCTSGCGAATLAAGATRTVTYTFTPTEPPVAGTPLSQLVSLTGAGRTETFTLTGTAALPLFEVDEQ